MKRATLSLIPYPSSLIPSPRMQAAFELGGAGPAAGAVGLVGADRPGAGPAADARIAPIVKGIVRHVVVENELPDVALGPVGERIDLDQLELMVPLDDSRVGASVSLIAANRADPCV